MRWNGPIVVFAALFLCLALIDLFYQSGLMMRDALRAQVRIAAALEKIVAIKDPELKAAAANKSTVAIGDEFCRNKFSRKDVFWNGIGCSSEVEGCAHGTGLCHQ